MHQSALCNCNNGTTFYSFLLGMNTILSISKFAEDIIVDDT